MLERILTALAVGVVAFVVVAIVLALVIWLLGIIGVTVPVGVYGVSVFLGVLAGLYSLVTGWNPFIRERI